MLYYLHPGQTKKLTESHRVEGESGGGKRYLSRGEYLVYQKWKVYILMHISAHPIDLKLTTPFRISRGVQETSPNVIVEITHNDIKGYGEASPAEYYGESPASVLACIELFKDDLGDDPFALADILQRLDYTIGLNPSAKAAVDMALYDLIGKTLAMPLYKLLGLNAAKTPYTSFTIGLDTPAQMAKKVLAAKDYPILKVKLGTKNDLDIIKAIRDVSSATLRVDANAAWAPKEAITIINALEPYDIEFIEQPVPAHDLKGLKLIHDNVAVPIIADESCVTIADIPPLSACVDGVNLKLMKSNGITNIIKMIHVARAHNLRIMLGCMI